MLCPLLPSPCVSLGGVGRVCERVPCLVRAWGVSWSQAATEACARCIGTERRGWCSYLPRVGGPSAEQGSNRSGERGSNDKGLPRTTIHVDHRRACHTPSHPWSLTPHDMSRRYGASGVSDRNAMLAGYGYGNYAASPQAPPIGRTASPFEQPYASTSASASAGSASARHPFASSSSQAQAQAQAQRASPLPQEDWSEYDRKKYDESPLAAGPSSSSSSKWWGGSDRQAEQLEEQNDERLQGLSDRVKILKDITLGIGNEVREGTKELGTLGEAMSGASAFLGGTFQRMNKMAKRQGGWFWNMMGFLLFVCWLFVSTGRQGKGETLLAYTLC